MRVKNLTCLNDKVYLAIKNAGGDWRELFFFFFYCSQQLCALAARNLDSLLFVISYTDQFLASADLLI